MVACGNEQVYSVDYGITFAAVMELSTAKVILVLAFRWGVPTRNRDIPNAYAKADKEEHLDIYLAIPQGMKIQDRQTQGSAEVARPQDAKRPQRSLTKGGSVSGESWVMVAGEDQQRGLHLGRRRGVLEVEIS